MSPSILPPFDAARRTPPDFAASPSAPTPVFATAAVDAVLGSRPLQSAAGTGLGNVLHTPWTPQVAHLRGEWRYHASRTHSASKTQRRPSTPSLKSLRRFDRHDGLSEWRAIHCQPRQHFTGNIGLDTRVRRLVQGPFTGRSSVLARSTREHPHQRDAVHRFRQWKYHCDSQHSASHRQSQNRYRPLPPNHLARRLSRLVDSSFSSVRGCCQLNIRITRDLGHLTHDGELAYIKARHPREVIEGEIERLRLWRS